jgi:glycosyltransferase involved in cell wall biosynthesis
MLDASIQSVLNQGYPLVEHLIIDGGSTDGTQDVLKRYPHLQVVIESDQGMYDAINKGIARARGELIGVLNSDDRYTTRALRTVANILQAEPDADVVWGAAAMVEMVANGEKIRSLLYPPKGENARVPFLLVEIPIFNACFFRRRVFERAGLLMEQLKIAGDREFMLRIALMDFKFHITDSVLYHYYAHDDSMTYGNSSNVFEKWNLEHCQIAQLYLDRKDTPGNARNAYRRMNTNSNLSLIKIAFKRRQFSIAGSLAIKGWRVDPLWPLIFLMRIPKIVKDQTHGVKSNDCLRR